MAEVEKKTGVFAWKGVLAGANRTLRIVLIVAIATACVSLVSTRLALITLAMPNGDVAHIDTFLLPVILGALLLGTVWGTLFGLITGVALFVHAVLLPLDYFELAFVTPITSIVLTSIFGFGMGIMLAALLRSGPGTARRIIYIIITSLVGAVVFNGAFAIIAHMSPTVSAAVSNNIFELARDGTGALVDSIAMVLVCILADYLARRSRGLGDDVGMRAIFGTWLTTAVVIAFMLSGVWSYASVTISELDKAEDEIRSEVNYLCFQLGRDTRASSEDILTGYTTERTGTVVLVHDEKVTASDDERFPAGERLDVLLDGNTLAAIDASLETGEMQGTLFESPQDDIDGSPATLKNPQIAYLVAGRSDDDTVFIIQPANVAFSGRFTALSISVLNTALLLIAVYIVVSKLLSNVVARRIDKTNEALARITSGELDTKVEAGGTKEFTSLSDGINETVDALKGWIAEAESRMDSELAAAKAIQESALPRDFPAFPEIPEFDLYASMNPAREVGGDFYDFFLIDASNGQPGKLGFVLADVSGKGVPAALFMMKAKTQIRDDLNNGRDLGEAIACTNRVLCDGNDAGMFVTAWIGVLDYMTGHIDYVNAGHNPPMFWHEGSWSWLTERSGLPLGLFDLPYEAHSLECREGDKVVLYTDGVTEAMSVEEELYGEERLEALLQDKAGLAPLETVDAIRASVAEHAIGAEQSDDITVLVLEIEDAEHPQES